MYRNGMEQLVNDDGGFEAGTVVFEEFDELVGITVQCTSQSERRPRRFGFTIMRNANSESHVENEVEVAAENVGFTAPPPGFTYRVHRTKPEGNGYQFKQTWPLPENIQGRTDGSNMRLTKI